MSQVRGAGAQEMLELSEAHLSSEKPMFSLGQCQKRACLIAVSPPSE